MVARSEPRAAGRGTIGERGVKALDDGLPLGDVARHTRPGEGGTVIGIEIDDTEIRRLVRTTMARTPDGWTTERLAGRLGLPIGTVVRALVDLARRGVVVHLDDEWYVASALLDADRMPDG
jgi:hypothetical protein